MIIPAEPDRTAMTAEYRCRLVMGETPGDRKPVVPLSYCYFEAPVGYP